MNRRRFVIGSAVAAGAGAAVAACNRSNILGPLTTGGHRLNVGYGTNTIAGKTMRTRTYNGSTVGPTLEVRPGETLRVTINNQLPPNPPQPVPAASAFRIPHYRTADEMMMSKPSGTQTATGAVDPMNNPNYFNTTNLHVHGIQTIPHLYDPVGTSNPTSMMIAIEPGESFTYNLPVPADQPSGLYWYHPHHHGATDVQVSGGMAGLIVVRGPIDHVPEIAAAREVFVVVQSINVNLAADGKTYDYEPVAYQNPTTNPNAYNGLTQYTMYTVNGEGVAWADNTADTITQLPVPQITMQPGEVIRVRLLNGTNGVYLPLVLPGMEAYLIGFDGVNLLAPLGPFQYDFAGPITQFNVLSANVRGASPGNRIEMLLQAPATPGTYTLSALAQSGVEFPLPQMELMQFVVSGAPISMNIPTTLPVPTREYPIIADSEIVARRTFQFHEAITQPPGFDVLLTGFWPWIDDALFDETRIDVSPQEGTAEEWTLVNQTTCLHPFHIHVNSFQLIAINGTPITPEVWDTFSVPASPATNVNNQVDGYQPPSSITIRLRFKEWKGKTVMHCHILGHEDTGMMKNMLIT